jgi:hypothetical protein
LLKIIFSCKLFYAVKFKTKPQYEHKEATGVNCLTKHINKKTKTLSNPYKSTWEYYSDIKALNPPSLRGFADERLQQEKERKRGRGTRNKYGRMRGNKRWH